MEDRKLDNAIEPAKLSTRCIVCDEEIELKNGQSDLVPRMCDKCRYTILYYRRWNEAIEGFFDRKC